MTNNLIAYQELLQKLIYLHSTPQLCHQINKSLYGYNSKKSIMIIGWGNNIQIISIKRFIPNMMDDDYNLIFDLFESKDLYKIFQSHEFRLHLNYCKLCKSKFLGLNMTCLNLCEKCLYQKTLCGSINSRDKFIFKYDELIRGASFIRRSVYLITADALNIWNEYSDDEFTRISIHLMAKMSTYPVTHELYNWQAYDNICYCYQQPFNQCDMSNMCKICDECITSTSCDNTIDVCYPCHRILRERKWREIAPAIITILYHIDWMLADIKLYIIVKFF